MQITLPLNSPDETAAFARALAARLGAGDTVLLSGEVGAGKTHLARALIQSLLATPEDVPSPTFTLVQTYETASGIEIWHADLYRLTTASEAEELGLTDAMEEAICLIEWPDRLGDLHPEDALDITLTATDADAGRTLTVIWSASRWNSTMTDLTT